MTNFIEIKQADPLKDKYLSGVQTFLDLLRAEKWVLQASTSFGKDSSVMLSMVLEAAKIASEQGVNYPPMVISHANTGIENPAIEQQIAGEIEKVKEYCAKHGIRYHLNLVKPRLMEGFISRIIGGNKLPSYEGGNAECSKSWKVVPQQRQAAAVARFVNKTYPTATLLEITGVRKDESEVRRRRIEERGDTSDRPFMYNDRWAISPLLEWEEEEIFMFLLNGDRYGSYSDLQITAEVYKDAGGGSCVVVGDVVSAEDAKSRGNCGARFGCGICTMTGKTDKSMEAMLALPKNEYMKELNAFRNYLQDIRWDLSRRRFLGRTIDENDTVGITPDVFNGETLEEMWRMILTMQVFENARSSKLGIKPRFSYINEAQIAAIDVQWSRYGFHKPFHAWVVFKEVYEEGKFLLPSKVQVGDHPRQKGFAKNYGRIKIKEPAPIFSPTRNLMAEALDEGRCDELSPISVGSTGKIVANVNFAETFDFDLEGLAMFVDFELDRHIEMYHHSTVNPTAAIKTYLQYGCFSTSTQGILKTDKILANTDRFWYDGLLSLSNDELAAMADKSLIIKTKTLDEFADLVEVPIEQYEEFQMSLFDF